jgi:hypothetical protein
MVRDFTNPKEADVDVGFMFWRLGTIVRFSGHVCALSVAQHHTLCGLLADRDNIPPEARIWSRLHDCHEYATGDVTRPVRSALGDNALGIVQARWDRAISGALGVSLPDDEGWAHVDRIDDEAMAIEWLVCLNRDPEEIGIYPVGRRDELEKLILRTVGPRRFDNIMHLQGGAAAEMDSFAFENRAAIADLQGRLSHSGHA